MANVTSSYSMRAPLTDGFEAPECSDLSCNQACRGTTNFENAPCLTWLALGRFGMWLNTTLERQLLINPRFRERTDARKQQVIPSSKDLTNL